MNIFYPFAPYEVGNDFSLLEDLDNSVEKQAHSISSNSYNVKFKDLQDNNMKYAMYSNTRSKHLPKNVRLQKYVNSIGCEDLTEVTLTDAITEPSDSPKSNYPIKNAFKNLDFFSKTPFLNKKIMLLAPDESYHNVKKFNNQINQKNCSYINGQNCGLIKFPLLRINDSNFQKEQVFPSIFPKCDLNINRNKFEFLISLDKFKDKDSHFLIDRIVENKNEHKNIINKQDLVNFNVDKNVENNLLNQSDAKIIEFENMTNSNGNNSPRDKFIDLIVNSSEPDIVLHNGYIITADSITSQKDIDIISNETNDFSNIKRIKGEIKSDRNNKATSSMEENKKIFQENKEKNQYGMETEGFNIVENLNKKVAINYEYPSLQDIPILAPDILGKINLRNNEKVKHFLGVKSIDENGWNEMISINLDNVNDKSSCVNELVLVDSENINIDKDSYTNKIMGTNKNQKNLSQTIQSMNEKISSMEKISLSLDKEFSNSKKVFLNTNETKVEINNIQFPEKMNDKLEKSLNLITNCEEKSSSRDDISLLYDLSEYSSANEVLDISERLSTNSIPLVELLSIDNAFNESIKESKVKNMKPISSRILKPSVKINKNKFHNELEKNNYLQRKSHGKYFAMEMLNQLGLPRTKSFDIPITIMTNPSPNEMMLSEMKRNDQLNLLNSMNNLKCTSSSLQPSKKKIHKPFQESVRLQRPEITRRQNLNKPFAYTESLLALKSKKRIHRNHKVYKNNTKLLQPLSEISISQDTDIISVSSDWSVPQKIHEILYNKSQNNSEYNADDVSQVMSIQSTSFIDWDQVSEMLKSLSVN